MTNKWREENSVEKLKKLLTLGNDIIVFDLETSGLNNKYHRIIELSGFVCECKENKFVPKDHFNIYFKSYV